MSKPAKKSMRVRSTNESGGIGVCGLLGIVFIVLKLLKVIEWNWLWVLAPFWIPFAIVVVLLIFLLHKV